MKRLLLPAAIAVMLSAAGVAQAATYLVHLSLGAARVTCTMETDGTPGTLAAGNITGYSLPFTVVCADNGSISSQVAPSGPAPPSSHSISQGTGAT